MEKIKIAVVYCTRYGHTKILAEAVVRGASEPDAEVTLYSTVEAAERMKELDGADAIVFGCPTFMGGMASEMKLFIEKGVTRWGKQVWADKIAGGFTNSSNFSGDKLNTMVGLMISAMQQGMIWVGVGTLVGEAHSVDGPGAEAINRNSASVGPMASSFSVNAPDAPPAGDVETAAAYGQRIASVTRRFKRGRV